MDEAVLKKVHQKTQNNPFLTRTERDLEDKKTCRARR
jgi:hypothetical protein